MRKYGMKLNLTKCTFKVKGVKFLGYMVTKRGIEANIEKIEAILQMPTPKSVKDIQKLAGRTIFLSNFISKSADKGRLVKWAIELGEFYVEFQPRIAIKGQVLADFLVEMRSQEGGEDQGRWILQVDSSSSSTKGGAGIVLRDP
ncbi:UNVERIFIED_CONTAM: hypothetical protein Sradi_5710900 [Sesamum radiatum]|uniref:Uncharacterized protein n=1 Tax=Sesamum radiatum TaxID=300843 RepID=A0AAW2L4E6_SESRA